MFYWMGDLKFVVQIVLQGFRTVGGILFLVALIKGCHEQVGCERVGHQLHYRAQ